MKAKINILLELDEDEVRALHKLLGNITHRDKLTKYNLTAEQASIISEIWDELCYVADKERMETL